MNDNMSADEAAKAAELKKAAEAAEAEKKQLN